MLIKYISHGLLLASLSTAAMVATRAETTLEKISELAPNEHANLTVRISGLANDRGQLILSLLHNEASFNEHEAPSRECLSSPKEGRAECKFSNLSFGDYAIFVFHDTNNNKKLDFSILVTLKKDSQFHQLI